MPSNCARQPDRSFSLRLVFAGTPEFAERSLARLIDAGHDIALVLTQPDRPAGRGMRALQSPVKRLAAARSIEVFQPQTLNSDQALARVQAARAEAIVVAAYGLLLPPPLLEATPRGALNIHASLLPRWRGAAPIQRALLAGDRETGVSIMQMDAGLDTGPVLAQRHVPVSEQEDAATLRDKLAALGAEAMLAVLEELGAGRARAVPQSPVGVTYARKIEKAETRIDWSRPALELERLVRALRPAPGAATTLQGEPLKIWRARLVARSGAPGELLQADDRLVVACGQDALGIDELQRAGGRRMSAGEFLRGRRLRPGERFS